MRQGRRCNLVDVAHRNRWIPVAREHDLPCSVNLNLPSTECGGWARIAVLVGPPPRPSAPPLPWKSQFEVVPLCPLRNSLLSFI